jgi:hypothetical protein
MSHHEDYSFGHLPPTATLRDELLRHPRNLVIVELFSSLILFTAGIQFPPILFVTIKATPRFALIR